MKVKDVMTRKVMSVKPDDSISSALGKIKKHSINQLPVMDGTNYVGMISLKDIAMKSFDPSQTKVLNLAVKTPVLKKNDDIEEAVNLILNSGLKALPVMDESLEGVISESDILSSGLSKSVLDTPIGRIATECDYVTKNDTAAKIRTIMGYSNVSRVPVIDGVDVVGVVGLFDLIKLVEGKDQIPARGGRTRERGAKEKKNVEDTPVENFMHPATIMDGSTKLKSAIKHLASNEEIVVLEDGVKIVTSKDVLEFVLGAPTKQIHVQIIGMKDESPLFTAKVDRSVDDFIKKVGKMMDLQYMFLHVEKYHKAGSKQKYSIRARLGTQLGLFVAKSWGWDPVSVAQEVMENLEREVIKKYGKLRDTKRKRIK